MRYIVKSFSETLPYHCLSPEHWLAEQTATSLSAGKKLGDLVTLSTEQSIAPENARYVLDTGNAREGFLDIPILGDPKNNRTSAKKIVREGDIIVSRLRPYLRQVALIPSGTFTLLDVKQLYCSTEFYVLRPLRGENIGHLVAWLLSEPVQGMMLEAATGGHHPRFNSDLILNAPVMDSYLDEDLALRISSFCFRHIEGQCSLGIALRHAP